jgi:hypothetical protein
MDSVNQTCFVNSNLLIRKFLFPYSFYRYNYVVTIMKATVSCIF